MASAHASKRVHASLVTIISASRLPISAIFLALALDPSEKLKKLSLVVLLILLVTDIVDGLLARRWDVTSDFGYILDGVADRASYLASLLILNATVDLSILVVYIVILRDILLYALRALHPTWSQSIPESRINAKINAVMLRLLLAFGFFSFYSTIWNVNVHFLPTHKDLLLAWNIGWVSYAFLAYWLLWRSYRLYLSSRT